MTSPTAAPPVAPEAERSAKGAEAFVRYFWKVYNYAYANGDSSLLAEISESDCAFCQGAIREIAKAQNQELTQVGGRINPLVVQAAPGEIAASIVVVGVLDQEASRVLNASGGLVTTSKALTSVNADARLAWKSRTWRMSALTTKGSN